MSVFDPVPQFPTMRLFALFFCLLSPALAAPTVYETDNLRVSHTAKEETDNNLEAFLVATLPDDAGLVWCLKFTKNFTIQTVPM